MKDNTSIVLLEKAHDRKSFDCGVPELNTFLVQYARQHMRIGYSITYVLIERGRTEICAYSTSASSEIKAKALPDIERRRLPMYPVPAVRLCRLATSIHHQGKGYGKRMLMDALLRAARISKQIGIHAVEVDAKDVSAREFYMKYGFKELLDDSMHLYISIETIQKEFQ